MLEKPTATQVAPMNWKEQKSRLKSKFPILTESDLHFEESKKEEMFKNLQTKLGKTREELNKAISAV